jgi:hypothetical protein
LGATIERATIAKEIVGTRTSAYRRSPSRLFRDLTVVLNDTGNPDLSQGFDETFGDGWRAAQPWAGMVD